VLPGRAEAKLEFRLVPDMTKDEAVTKLKAHLAKRGFDDMKVVVSGGYGPNQTDENSPFIQAQKKVFERAGIPYTLSPRNAGSWPGVVFNGAPLNLPTGQFGIGRGSGESSRIASGDRASASTSSASSALAPLGSASRPMITISGTAIGVTRSR
jgi:hypothetical protein